LAWIFVYVAGSRDSKKYYVFLFIMVLWKVLMTFFGNKSIYDFYKVAFLTFC